MILAYAVNGEGGLDLELFVGMQSHAKSSYFPCDRKSLCGLYSGYNGQSKGNRWKDGETYLLGASLGGNEVRLHVGSLPGEQFDLRLLAVWDSQRMFDKMPTRDVASWSALVQSYAENEVEGKAIKACCFERVKAIHSLAANAGFDQDIFVESSLVDAYAKCGNIKYGRRAFDRIKGRNLVLWNIMILGYAENGDGESALELFGRMQTRDRIVPDARSYVAVLKLC
ncbi:pentatricopeptide repeat-containing protein At1g11290, chloroplastic-like [Selaginella moellendorffii]|uniref:pentatricopeptide repeat-containing protein At1g11290, chloroplastic-like n=1 Tax=Selaginella moellendorffii TaxID=88036 RepID=UPI000D1CFFBF|nr:pentatricopeptide repeat-containing protein At1g11290, chloroplastic-like [Selaginella moellendorffii]|eukprot:XP_024541791.1 pentatricopeptide repeat-containing protein At1g11290, chloroplastic-like [Selaginella moellendorffii]